MNYDFNYILELSNKIMFTSNEKHKVSFAKYCYHNLKYDKLLRSYLKSERDVKNVMKHYLSMYKNLFFHDENHFIKKMKEINEDLKNEVF